MINSIPNLKIDAQGSVDMKENEKKISRKMKLDFYGDALIDSPTTFEGAVKVYKELPTLAKTSQSVVRFSLSPISDYCTASTTILNQISGNNVKKVRSENQIFCLKSRVSYLNLNKTEMAFSPIGCLCLDDMLILSNYLI